MLAMTSTLRATAALAAPVAARAYAAAAAKSASVAHTKGPAAARPAWAKGLPSLGHILDAQLSRKRTHRDCLRVCHQDERLTFEEALETVNAVGNGLHENRVLPGKHLALVMASDVEAVCTMFGAAKAGAVASWINASLGADAIATGLQAVSPRGLFVSPYCDGLDTLGVVYDTVPELERLQLGEVLRSKTFPNLKTVCHTAKEFSRGIHSIHDLLLFDPMPDPLPRLAKKLSADSVGVEYVDGSGNKTQFTHNQLIDAAFNLNASMGLAEDRVVIGVDISSPIAQTTALACAASDSLAIVPSGDFDADLLVREAATERASVIVTTPKRAAIVLESSRLSREDLSSLHTVVLVNTPGDQADAGLIKKVQNNFEVANMMVGFAAPGSAPFLLSKVDPSAPGATGRVVANAEIKIADGSGKSVAVGQTGSLMSKGVHNGQTTADGWVESGAQASMDANGNVSLA